MARDFNQNRIANARLVSASIDKFGKTFAIQSPYNADGFSSVNVTVEQAPTNIKQYLEGDNSITVYPVPSNVDKLCELALTSFPNIEDLYLFKTSAIVVLEDDLSYLLDLNKIYVPSDLLSAYQSAYPTISSKFDIIVEDYTLTIPFVGDSTLTSEYVDSVIAMLSSTEKNAITKIVIPTDFTQESANEIAWGYDFSAIVNLDDNIWYGTTQYDFSVFTIQDTTQDHILTASVVEAELGKINSDKLTLIEKIIVPNSFTNKITHEFDDLTSALPNLKTLESYIRFASYTSRTINGIELYIGMYERTANGEFYNVRGLTNFFFPNLTYVDIYGWEYPEDLRSAKIYAPNVVDIQGHNFGRWFINTSNCSLGYEVPKVYCKTTDLTNYVAKGIGVIDGTNKYTKYNLQYPTLTGIDTEANIQLLTPADGSLYLASDTGNLWKYDSANSQWVNLFSGYTPTWYINEDVSTIISPSAMNTSHTYYVKLTAI